MIKLSLCGLLLVWLGSACVPNTKYIRTANIAAPSGETLTLPMHDKIELSGSVAYTDTHPSFFDFTPYVEGDPLVSPSTWEFAGLARFSVHPNIAIGAQGSVGLLPQRSFHQLPFDNTVVWGVGPNIGFHFHPWSENFTIGFSAALTMMATPWTVWERTSNPDNFASLFFDASQYQQVDSGTDFLPLFRGSVGASYLLVEHVEFFGGLSLQNSATNIGFDDISRSGSTLTADMMNLVPYLGAGVLYKPFFARLQIFTPVCLSHSDQVYVGSQLQMGAAF